VLARLLIAIALCAVLAAPAAAQTAPSPGAPPANALCPRLVPPDPNCYTIPIPSEGWLIGTIVDVNKRDKRATALYDQLLAQYAPGFGAPKKRQIALLQFRLNVPGTPSAPDRTNPGPGYGEASIALRASFDGKDGYPWEDGWFPLAQPVNDSTQYGAGRADGIPKYMADISMTHDDGGWHGSVLNWGGPDAPGGPGSATVPGGNSMRLDWAPSAAPAPANAEQILSWTQLGEPLFTEVAPYDVRDADHAPWLVKFTPVPFAWGSGADPLTTAPPTLGTTTVSLQGTLPRSPSKWRGQATFADLLGTSEPITVPGGFWYARGITYLTVDTLSDNAEPAKPKAERRAKSKKRRARR
jgi:hypothetical protein